MAPSFWNWDWVFSHLELIGDSVVQHLWLTLLAVAIGFAISFPLAVLAHRRRHLFPAIAWVTGILYTIPSLALLSLLVPFTGLSTLTAEIALVSYTLLILIRNIVTGLAGVPEDVKEAARGMGHTDRQILWRVEVPLALPAIVAGVRIATVTTIGLVTVTALIGKGGLGYLMLGGFRPLLPDIAILVGVILSVMLAVIADAVLLGGQHLVSPWGRSVRARAAGARTG
jgi:osmoprotectant transport system permease protein